MDESLSTPRTPDYYVSLRERMDAAAIDWCIAGGQAVNVWAMHYGKVKPVLRSLGPFTSKDIDPLLLSLDNTEKCPELKIVNGLNTSALSGVVFDPATGHLGETLKYLPGVPDSQWRNRLTRRDGWPLVPPDALYATKCWNLLNVPQSYIENGEEIQIRGDVRHIMLMNYVLDAHWNQADEEERHAMLNTYQQLAVNGTLAAVIKRLGPEVTSSITPHVFIPDIPVPTFHVASGLHEEIRRLSLPAPNVHTLSLREEEWATLVVQFQDEAEAERMFTQSYGPALTQYLAKIQR